MTRVPLNETVAVRLDGSGNGTASIGPLGAREKWHPANIQVSASSNVLEAQCNIYVGDGPRPDTNIGGTFSGSSGDTLDSVTVEVGVGWKVWAVWTGGDPTATATLNVMGTKDV